MTRGHFFRSVIERPLATKVLCGLFLLVGSPILCAQTYIVKDLGTLGGTLGSAANAINSSGQVVGYAFTTNNAGLHATLFSGTGSNNTDLGGLAGAANNNGEAYGINDSGQIIGHATAPGGNVHATLFSGTGSGNSDLGTLGGVFSFGRAINSAGQLVGQADAGLGRAVLFSGTGSGNTDLGGVGGGVAGIAYATNTSGQIVGQATTAAQADRATLFTGTGSGNLDLGTLGGFNSSAYGINDLGQIVGSSALTGNSAFHAVLFSGTGSNNTDLGTLGGTDSHAYAINNAGVIVGNSQTAVGAGTFHAFIYSNGTMQDLNDLVVAGSGVTNIRLQDNARVPGKCINDAGQIAATGDVLGATHAILLTPGIAPPTVFGNISTRLRVETGDNVLIGGFIITGTQPKKVMVRAIGPSIPLPDKLADPTLELFGPSGLITSNDNWMDAPNKQEIIDTTIAPVDDLESAILATLPANSTAYTAIVRGINNTTGIGLVEVYDLDQTVDSKLANISTRGLVQTDDNVMIGGLIVLGSNPQKVIVRAIGPSLPLSGSLADPTLDLFDGNGTLVMSDDNWRDNQEAEISATGLAPTNDAESAIVQTLQAGAGYTAIVRGKNNTTGVALVEVYDLGPGTVATSQAERQQGK
jgi:probable HAF family extracellular repeat protein